MEFLYVLEGLRTPFLDQFFSLVTHLGSEIVFMVLAVIMYWCVSKQEGLYLLSVGCFGTTVNQYLKLKYRVPRPWVRDPNFTIVESARADGTFGCMAMGTKKNIRWLYVFLAALTAFSRMYLGVHTPEDVLVSAAISIVMVVCLRPLFLRLDEKPVKGIWILLAFFAISILYLVYANVLKLPPEVDQSNLEHGIKNAAKLAGAIFGMILGYAIDLKWVKFDTKAPLIGQILKCVLGLALVLAIKEGLKPVLGSSNLSAAVRYGLMTLFAGGIWPMTFAFFTKIPGKKV